MVPASLADRTLRPTPPLRYRAHRVSRNVRAPSRPRAAARPSSQRSVGTPVPRSLKTIVLTNHGYQTGRTEPRILRHGTTSNDTVQTPRPATARRNEHARHRHPRLHPGHVRSITNRALALVTGVPPLAPFVHFVQLCSGIACVQVSLPCPGRTRTSSRLGSLPTPHG